MLEASLTSRRQRTHAKRRNISGLILIVGVFSISSLASAETTTSAPAHTLDLKTIEATAKTVCQNGPATKPKWGRSAADLHIRHGWKMVTMGKGGDASQAFLTALHIGPERPDAYWGLGVATHLAKFPLKIVTSCFTKTFKLLPEEANPHSDYGNVLLQRNLLDEAMTHFQMALEIDRNNIAALVGTARIYHTTDRLVEAQEVMTRVDDLEKKSKAK